MLGVWAAPGAPEALPKGGGEAPHLLEGPLGPLGPVQTQMADFRSSRNLEVVQPPKVQPRRERKSGGKTWRNKRKRAEAKERENERARDGEGDRKREEEAAERQGMREGGQRARNPMKL